jgi:hypothetical protein
MIEINWIRLIRAIRNEGSVLFIGPNVEKDEKGNPIFQQLCQKMVEDYKGEISYDEKEGFLFFIEPGAKNDVNYSLKEFYEKNDFGKEIYSLIATIPFHLIVSLSPDDSIHNIFSKNGIEHHFVSFDSNNSEVEKPTKEKPLIYSMFGLARDNRYILSQEDYYNYIMTIAGDKGLPMKLRMALSTASNYIFIGFDFEKWYVRLLLMILNFHTDKEGKTRHAIQPEKTDLLYKQLTEKQFNITFIENDELDFIQTFSKKIADEGIERKLIPENLVLQKELTEKVKLIGQYDEELVYEKDPMRRLEIEKKLKDLKDKCKDIEKRLKDLENGK